LNYYYEPLRLAQGTDASRAAFVAVKIRVFGAIDVASVPSSGFLSVASGPIGGWHDTIVREQSAVGGFLHWMAH
jgi:hypothetical protein